MKNLTNNSGTITKFDKAFMLFLTILTACFVLIIVYRDQTHKEKFSRRVERMNTHIKYLHDEEGYSWEAARKIGATEAGFIPMDDDYILLKED